MDKFFHAAHTGDLETLKQLPLEKINEKDHLGYTLLLCALEMFNRTWRQQGALPVDFDNPRGLEVIQFLIQNGADCSISSPFQNTALFWSYKMVKIAKWILKSPSGKKINIDQVAKGGFTALSWAVQTNLKTTVLLLRLGIDWNKGERNETPMDLATKNARKWLLRSIKKQKMAAFYFCFKSSKINRFPFWGKLFIF